MRKKIYLFLVFILVIILSSSCASDDNAAGNAGGAPVNEPNAGESGGIASDPSSGEEPPDSVSLQEKYADDLGEYDFGGADFVFTSWRFGSCRNEFAFEEETGDIIDDAIHMRNRILEDRFNVNIREIEYQDGDGSVRRNIRSGSTVFHVANVRCPEAFTFWCENLLIPTEQVPHLDLAKPYWSQSINESISIGSVNYVALGALDISTYEQTFALVFNKKFLADYGLENPYELVRDGKWTFDKMNEMMKRVLNNTDASGEFLNDGIYGYMGHIKHVMPGFWVGAGEIILRKDEHDMPYLSMNGERFLTVFNKIFEITWDSMAWFRNTENASLNIPEINMSKFQSGQSLFMDTSFHFIQNLRGMETDFGILPYPKFDEQQQNYYTRLSYYYPLIVPSTVSSEDLEMTGVMLEALNSQSAITVVPVYYDTALKTKFARDEESVEMIDLIFASRVSDLADSKFCDIIRDGFIASMFAGNNRNIVSRIESTERAITSRLNRIPGFEE